ncbi:hypothetical protein ACG33_13940 [Steroidobacter denitrificans]|uniref:Uncharacterized protein n=1 Tax=Steroidobacter denitrificans TaxID=465721 RepID=A0A127FEC4_STEDE|nr:hypothetical protein ACG33_13940 [Steroidobacter denitrificans]
MQTRAVQVTTFQAGALQTGTMDRTTDHRAMPVGRIGYSLSDGSFLVLIDLPERFRQRLLLA